MNNCNTRITSDEPPPIHGDVLEAILSHVPLIHLIPASHVSKTWTTGVSSALRTSTNTKPWLILHTQSHRHPYLTTTHAYDPESNSWIQIHSPPLDYVSTIRSSHSNLLYMLSPSNLSLSFDPLHLTWHHAAVPKVSRIDPVVAVVGKHVVIAGGAFDFENEPLAVEVYDLRSHNWTRSDPMPEYFNGSGSSTWLSVASDDNRLFVMEKSSGVTYCFVPSNNNWSGPYDLRPDRRVFHSVIGFSNRRLIVIEMLGEPEDVNGVKLREVNCDSFECYEIGEMPANLVENLKSVDSVISSADVVMAGNVEEGTEGAVHRLQELGWPYSQLKKEQKVQCLQELGWPYSQLKKEQKVQCVFNAEHGQLFVIKNKNLLVADPRNRSCIHVRRSRGRRIG